MVESVEQRLDALQRDLNFLAIRHSAIEYVTEQISTLLLSEKPGAEDYLDMISLNVRKAWQDTDEGPLEIDGDEARALFDQIAHIADKIADRIRVRGGR